MFKKLKVILAILVLAAYPVTSYAQFITMTTIQQIEYNKLSNDEKKLYEATFALYGQAKINGEEIQHFMCTATAIEKTADGYLLLTAGHCVLGEFPEGIHFSVAPTIADAPELQPVEIVSSENTDQLDFAILHLKSDKVIPVIEVSSDPLPELKAETVDVNFTLGIGKIVSVGRVASAVLTTKGSEGDCSFCLGRFVVHMFAGPGASGSAIVDKKTHKIIGIEEAGFRGATVGALCETMIAFREFLIKHSSDFLKT